MLNRIRRFGFRLLYNECAFAYDRVSRLVSLSQWRCWQRSVIPFLPPNDAGLILELAHGSGDLQLDLAESGIRAIGLDLSANMGRLASRKLERAGLSVRLLRGDAGRLPIRSNSVSAIVCTFPTAFIVEAATLNEIERVLKRGSPAVIVLSGLLTDGGWRARVIRILYRLTGQSYSESKVPELRSMFQAPGLSAQTRALALGGSQVRIALLRKGEATVQV